MTETTKPVIIIVTGAWHIPEHYAKVSNRLRHLGYLVECPRLATNNNAKPANKSVDDDVALVRQLALNHLDKGHNVVAIMHSYGGIVGSTAFAELGPSSRLAKAHVQALLYVAAFVPLQGESLFQIIGGTPAPWFHAHDMGYLEVDSPVTAFYNDVTEAECNKAVSALVVHATRAQTEAPSQQLQKDGLAWLHIPTTYLLCENDHALPLKYQEMMLDRMEAMYPHLKVRREACASGHSPFLSDPDCLLRVINSIA
jgi:pimeloyl-ACP methyl ester carboxylesterase